VPDGPLALLPFEALVVESGDQSRYLLDVGPPIAYAPSATVLYNLVEHRSASATLAREPVLTVGDPIYVTRGVTAASNTALDSLSARSQFKARGGELTPLPFSGQEAVWVRDVFRERGQTALLLQQGTATEAQVRAALPGRKIVHLACHGLVDQSYGNFFGALALTMGNDAKNPADDGFLTLAEIYGLNLKSCELAILSACETNFGPQQHGEGTWALSRGFLVAGSRRVVASNWIVDDEAAASLISYYCAGLAQSQKDGAAGDYAKSLQAAKRWVRNQEKWRSPYYWGTFVLVGPN
jgi:CHAT domain-containing protein